MYQKVCRSFVYILFNFQYNSKGEVFRKLSEVIRKRHRVLGRDINRVKIAYVILIRVMRAASLSRRHLSQNLEKVGKEVMEIPV